MGQVILEARGLHKSYQLGPVRLRVLRGCDLRVGRGEFVAIVGPSGSGKSTLLHLLGALDEPDEGQVLFEGRDVFSLDEPGRDELRNRAFGFVFQFYHLLPELDVLENVLLPAMAGRAVGRWADTKHDVIGRAKGLLGRLGLSGRLRHRPSQLSGGERQRVAIARALINSPAVLLADEPTGNLDAQTGREILEVFQELHREGQTIVVVTHEEYVARRAERIVRLAEGRLHEVEPHDAAR